jgi:hypothetical protein
MLGTRYNATTRFPCVKVVVALVRSGLNVDAADMGGKTALHVVAEAAQQTKSVHAIYTIKELLKSGAHIDYADYNNATIFDYLDSKQVGMVPRAKHQTLKCLAAQVVSEYELDVTDLHPTLREFVLRH